MMLMIYRDVCSYMVREMCVLVGTVAERAENRRFPAELRVLEEKENSYICQQLPGLSGVCFCVGLHMINKQTNKSPCFHPARVDVR